MKNPSLTVLMSFLILSLVSGFLLLGLVWQGSFVIKLMVGLLIAGLSVVLLVFSVRFDRAIKQQEKGHEKQKKT
jgi:uncharacterized membrane protein YedE/YeeE